MVKLISVLLFILLIGFVALPACSGAIDSKDDNAPDFKLKDLYGQTVTLSSFKGKPVLINFWATTCPPCVEEMPDFQALYEEWLINGKAALLAINIGENPVTVGNFMQSKNYSFPVLMDTEFKVAELYGIQYTPTTILVGKDGQVKSRVIGPFKDKAAVLKSIAPYLD